MSKAMNLDNNRNILNNEMPAEYGGVTFKHLELSDLRTIKVLGGGASGRVDLVQILGIPVVSFALKVVKKAAVVQEHHRRHLLSEAEVMKESKSPFLVRLHRTFKDSKYLYLLMEACLGGDLWSILEMKRGFDEGTTRFYVACILEGLEFLHSRNIVYRDLKLENMLVDDSGYLKLCDFGFCKKLEADAKTSTMCGTTFYMSPEVIQGNGHDISTDYWSLGIVIYEMLNFKPPFSGSNMQETFDNILEGTDSVSFPESMGENSVDLFKRLCTIDPVQRLGYHNGGMNGIRQHKWFDGFDFLSLRTGTMQPPIKPYIKHPTDTRNFLSPESVSDSEEATPDDFSDWDANF